MADKQLDQTYSSLILPIYDVDKANMASSDLASTSVGGLHQAYLNFIPRKHTNVTTGEYILSLEKREGFQNNMDVKSKAGFNPANTLEARDFISIGPLSDIFVGAFFRDNGGTSSIEIIQIRPVANTVTVIGQILTVAGPPAVNVSDDTDVYLSEIKIGQVPGVAVVITDKSGGAGTSAGYYALSAAGVFGAATLTKIADADFPTNQTPYLHLVGPMVQMNQITYAMVSDGRIFNSNDDSIGTWSALGFLEAESYSDKGVCLVRYKHHIVAFGEATVEFFNDVGNDPTLGSPLERTEQAFIKFGAIYGKSVINVDDVLYWISASPSETAGLWRLNEYAPVMVSTPKMNLELMAQGLGKNAYNIQQLLINGTKNVIISGAYSQIQSLFTDAGSITTVTNEPTWTANTDGSVAFMCLNLETGIVWYMNLASPSTTLNIYCASSTSYGVTNAGRELFKTYCLFGTPNNNSNLNTDWGYRCLFVSNGNNSLYRDWNPDTQDQTYYFPFVYQTNLMRFGTEKRKFIHKIKLVTDPEIFTSDTNPNHVKLLVYRNHPYTGAPTPQIRTMALPATTGAPVRIYWNNFGHARKWGIVVAGKTKDQFYLNEIHLDISQGSF